MLRNLFRKLSNMDGGPPRKSSRLSERLADYPGWHAPHLGTNGAYPGSSAHQLDEQALRANLRSYVSAMPKRIEVLAQLLGELGLNLGDAYDETGREPFIRSLHLMLLSELPSTYRPELRDFHAWESSDRTGTQIVYSLLGDIAMLFADVLLKAKPGCFLGMNLDPADREMTSYGRPCMLGLSDSLFPGTPMILDFEEEMFGVYRRMDHPQTKFAKAETVAEGVSGRMIGFSLLEACQRSVVEPDLPKRRIETWMARAV
jgi:hypothetical protein